MEIENPRGFFYQLAVYYDNNVNHSPKPRFRGINQSILDNAAKFNFKIPASSPSVSLGITEDHYRAREFAANRCFNLTEQPAIEAHYLFRNAPMAELLDLIKKTMWGHVHPGSNYSPDAFMRDRLAVLSFFGAM